MPIMKRINKMLCLFSLIIFLPGRMQAQDSDMTPREELNFAVIVSDSKMIEKAILRGAKLDLNHLVSAIGVMGFPDKSLEQRKGIVKLIVQKINTVNGMADMGETALTSLAKSHLPNQAAESPVEIAEWLVRKGAKINEPNKEGRTALNIICDNDIFMDMEHRVNFATILLQNGANKEFQSNQHMHSEGTPLMNAAANGYIDLVKLLLDKGANANAKNEQEETALIKVLKADQALVANEEKKMIIQLLISKGADPKKKNAYGESAWDLAKNENMASLFNEPVKSAASNTNPPVKQKLVPVAGRQKGRSGNHVES